MVTTLPETEILSPAEVPVGLVAGTLVETGRGRIAVEDLEIGDSLRTLSGAMREVVWIGRHDYGAGTLTGAAGPIALEAGALADGQPTRPSRCLPGQGILVDTALVNVDALLNGRTIRREAGDGLLTCYRPELDTPDIILANGMELALTCGGNRGFFHLADRFDPGLPACAPLERLRMLTDGLALAAIQLRLIKRAMAEVSSDSATAAPCPSPRGPERTRAGPSREILIVTQQGRDESGRHGQRLARHVEAFGRIGFSVVEKQAGFPRNGVSVEDLLSDPGHDFAVVYLDGVEIASRYAALAGYYRPAARLLFVAERLLFPALAQRARLEGTPEAQSDELSMRLRECAVASQVDAILLEHGGTGNTLKQLVPSARIFGLSDAVGVRSGGRPGRDLVFPGAVEGGVRPREARLILERIMPRVWTARPDTRCHLVVAPEDLRWVERELDRRVRPVPFRAGCVEKLMEQAYLSAITECEASSSSTNMRISLSAGIPCVVSPDAARGASMPDAMMKRLAAADEREFAEKIVSLYDNELAYAAAVVWGARHARETYGDAQAGHTLDEVMALLLPAG